MNKEQQELVDGAYKTYLSSKSNPLDGKYGDISVRKANYMYPYEPILSQEEFIDKIKTDPEFSKMWGLIIQERELSLDERNHWFQIHLNGNNPIMKSDWKDYELDQQNVPSKLITIAHTQTFESYE